MTNLTDLTDQLLAAALHAGADAADALVSEGVSIAADVRNGALEQAERAEGVDLGLRVFVGQRQAIVSASDARATAITAMAERAVAMARLAPEDPFIGLADPGQLAQTWDNAALDLADPVGEPAPAALEEAARIAEAAALDIGGISQVETSSAAHSRTTIHLAATNGFAGGYTRTSNSLYCVAITGEGTKMERDYYGEARIYRDDLPSAEETGKLAAERTLARSGARKPPTGAYPVIYDERIASGLIGHLLQAANGSMIARGSSWLRDRLGKEVLPSDLSIVEDPHRPRVSSSRMFDAEGLATRKREIVSGGVLQGWTLDLATARKLGMESTANAGRSTGSSPSPMTGNIELTPGDVSRDDLIRDAGTGLLVTSLIGSSINSTTGDYSRGASGFWIENGEIAYPVNECTIAGNLHDMLRSLRPANDARRHLSRVVPSLLVEGLTIAGG